MVILVVCGAILWTPSELYLLLVKLANLPSSDPLRYFFVFLTLFNACINPLIYAVKMEDVKEHILKVIVCSERRQQESGSGEVVAYTIPTLN